MTKRTSKAQKKANKAAKVGNASSMKMTMYTAPTMVPRAQLKERRPGRPSTGKRLALVRNYPGKIRSMVRRNLDPCENSNDSGLGFDQHTDPHSYSMTDRLNWTDERAQAKRSKVDIKLENDEVNENYSFPEHVNAIRDNNALIRTVPAASASALNVNNTQATTSRGSIPRCLPVLNRSAPAGPVTLTTLLQPSSRYMNIGLSILCQPEQQHRARYQTEGSRGAVKDRSGNGFPIVQLTGYSKPANLQVFIGTDIGKVAPHMFYQACRVSGKNSTQCQEKTIDGTVVIELMLNPSKDLVATCDCVGILKERNVDVEHRFPEHLASRSKKKSTRCRMIFRTTITHDNGTQETLQICSQPIVCTQPPGIPEISKKSLTSCPAGGGLELFVIGKNFLKDTVVYFQSEEDMHRPWEQSVVPDKEFLQQTHLVCLVPPYLHPDITEPVTVRLYVVSSGKTSEAHQFVYTPVNGAMPSVHAVDQQTQQQTAPFLSKMLWSTMTKQEQDVDMMPPPGTSLVPLSQRRPSATMSSVDDHSPPLRTMKQELMDENSQNSVMDASELSQGVRYRNISESSLDVNQGDSNISMINDNSIDILRHNQMMHVMNENSNMSIGNENSMDLMNGSNICENMNDGNGCNNFAQALMRQNEMQAELKVIDLRMKMPMATVADLVNTNAPSMATLQSFGVTESTNLPLPNQTGQSIENYLNNIEIKAQNQQVLTNNLLTTANLISHEATSFLNSPLSINVGTKTSEAAAVGEQQNNVTTILPNPITTEKLDAMVNCAVESHIAPKDEVLLTTQDVMLNATLPRIHTPMSSPQLPPSLLSSAQTSPNIAPNVILNSQISPSLMCRSNSENLLPQANMTNVENTPMLLTTATNLVSEPEKVLILNAAVDLLETQKKFNDYQPTMINNILTTSNTTDVLPNLDQLPNNGNNFLQYTTASSSVPIETTLIASKSISNDNKQEYVLTVTKKSEDRMIPPSFATMSENDLINIINPSCFDQV
ncbi:PREDICTED: nuclear factor of activated T-cells 5 isoform X2 [Nicrophorus vespilloides]|uniref:Nuclear factor of activated T-cells 5 isoform X2 n=1 Tax=Nicrophorus vespilloides TaxID=110193 RepID=A0ABM1M581_NICVS|nr:PREDICTED: nuclear factor of activated T-cells 5 isoform X2 [Nicrophorus vespilloides]